MKNKNDSDWNVRRTCTLRSERASDFEPRADRSTGLEVGLIQVIIINWPYVCTCELVVCGHIVRVSVRRSVCSFYLA